MSCLPDKLAIVDVETTGLSPVHERIIEIAILRVENGKIIREMETLVNPEISLPPEIVRLTGINPEDLIAAPRFFDIKDEIREILDGTVFLAHNAHFDYGFIKNEFARYGEAFHSKRLDTVRLFRSLYPQAGRFNLDRMIEFFNLTVKERHRAGADTRVLYDFLKIVETADTPDVLVPAVSLAMNRPNIPPGLKPGSIDNLPESPGVYLFYGDDGTPLYIGKSINIRERVLSHFAATARSGKELKIFQQVKRIESRTTTGELSALLLEATLVKKLQPVHNRKLRALRKVVATRIVQPEGSYMNVMLERTDHIDSRTVGSIAGIFRSDRQAKDTLLSIARDHALCPKLLGLESGHGVCFWHGLGWCHGACAGKEMPARYNLRFMEAFSRLRFRRWPFPGAIIIRESPDNSITGILCDQWCILGNSGPDGEIVAETGNGYVFDMDTYKILVRYLFEGKNQKNIAIVQSRSASAVTSENPGLS